MLIFIFIMYRNDLECGAPLLHPFWRVIHNCCTVKEEFVGPWTETNPQPDKHG